MKLVLASASPRRLDLVHQLGWEAQVHTAAFDEAASLADLGEKLARAGVLLTAYPQTKPGGLPGEVHAWDWLWPFVPDGQLLPETLVAYNAHGKAQAVAQVLREGACPQGQWPLLAADTIVVHGNAVLGKPRDAADAARMLRGLSGDWHRVLTGFCCCHGDLTAVSVATTRVHFRALTDAEIEAYVATGEPLDKAGAYGIQGRGAVLVDKLEGCYNNVVGLPLTAVYEQFCRIGVVM